MKAKEAANENDETRKRFEILCREVFSKFKACITMSQVNAYRDDRNAVNVIYKSLQKDSEEADITAIIRELHDLVDDAIAPRQTTDAPDRTYDISKIDFERLKTEFARTRAKNTTVQCLRTSIEKQLQRMIAQNPLRADFQAHWIVYRALCLPGKRVKLRFSF